jgi:hypothetical protein
MWSKQIADPEYATRLAELKAAAHARAGEVKVVSNA